MTLATLPAALAAAALLVTLAGGPTSRRSTGLLLVAAAAASLATTAVVVLADGVDVRSTPGFSTQAEVVAILVMIVVSARWAPSRHAVIGTGLAATAVGVIVLRFRYAGDDGVTIVGIAAWAIVALSASAVGLHLRSLDERRVRAVWEAQRAQRLHLARDLHDFVAHDVSEMLAQAQAGQVLAADHPQCEATFSKIEQAAQRALRSMDQTVQILHAVGLPHGTDELGLNVGPFSLSDLGDVVARFADANGLDAELRIEKEVAQHQLQNVPHEVSATLYRVAVEALTNVRRHAPGASTVTVELRRSVLPGGDEGIELSLIDDAPHDPPASPDPLSRQNGLGLPSLAERVQGLGGQFLAGPVDPAGWSVTATVPLPGTQRSRV